MAKKIIFLFLIVIFFGSCGHQQRQGIESLSKMPRVCYVKSFYNNNLLSSSGSATYIGEVNKGFYFFTASHVVKNGASLYVYLKEEGKKTEKLMAKIIWQKKDLTIIYCAAPDNWQGKMAGIELVPDNITPNKKVFVEGYPNHERNLRGRAMQYLSCVDSGLVDMYFTILTRERVSEWSICITMNGGMTIDQLKGHSGGAIWSNAKYNELAGIVWAAGNNAIYGIPASVIRERIAQISNNIFPQSLKDQLSNESKK